MAMTTPAGGPRPGKRPVSLQSSLGAGPCPKHFVRINPHGSHTTGHYTHGSPRYGRGAAAGVRAKPDSAGGQPGPVWFGFLFFSFLKKDFIYLFLEWGREGEREGEKHQYVVASLTPPTGDLARNQAFGQTWNRTRDPLVCRLALNPLSCTSQGCSVFSCPELSFIYLLFSFYFY